MSRFIKTELISDWQSDLDSDLEKIEAKNDNELESGSDSKWKKLYLIYNFRNSLISLVSKMNFNWWNLL